MFNANQVPCQKTYINTRQGLRLYNQKEFYSAHEFFEDAWRGALGDSREFFRALLQISAGYYRLTQNRSEAAKKFFSRALYWLQPFPKHHLGFDVIFIKDHIQGLIEAINSNLPSESILEALFQPLYSAFINIDMDKMKILISGFEPFGDHGHNVSMALVQALPDYLEDQIVLNKVVLPVDDVQGPRRLLKAIDQYQPDAVLCFGLAPNRQKINLERVAINLKDYRIPDNSGVQIIDQPIITDGPAAYFSTLPIRKMLRSLTAADIPARISLSAGAYLCNQVFYATMHQIKQNNWPIRAGFIHLPSFEESKSPSEDQGSTENLATCITAARILIKSLFEENETLK